MFTRSIVRTARVASRANVRSFSASASAGPASKINRNSAIVAGAGLTALLFVGSGGSAKNKHAETEPVAVAVEELVAAEEPAAEKEDQATAAEEAAKLIAEKMQEAIGDFIRATQVNRAFVFIKPHAANDKVDELVKDRFKEKSISVVSEGTLTHDVIDEKSLIDTHYGAIASKAVVLHPSELNVPEKGKKDFEAAFGMTWQEALDKGLVYNAKEGSSKLGVDGAGLDEMWSTLKKGSTLIKFSGGQYVGKVGDIFVINGFYMAMRGKYTSAPAQIKYYLVEWDPTTMSWEDFRTKLLGATDPTAAEAGSLRREIYEKWESLELPAQPDTGDNGLHASASPLEAMAERVNWTGASVEQDPFGRGLLACGMEKSLIEQWMADAQVSFLGKKESIFDLLEDTDSSDCLVKAATVFFNMPQE